MPLGLQSGLRSRSPDSFLALTASIADMGKKKAAPRPPPPPPPQSSPSSVSLPPILLHAFVLLLGYLVARLSLRHLSPPASLPPPPEVPCSPTSTAWQSSFLFPPSDLSSLASRGLHYLCVSPLNSSHSLLTVYPHASLAGSFSLPLPPSAPYLALLSPSLPSLLPPPFPRNPPALFSPKGLPLPSPPPGLSLLYEGGAYIPPGVAVNHTQAVELPDRVLTLRTLSLVPLVFGVDEPFLSPEEADRVQELVGSSAGASAQKQPQRVNRASE